MNRVKLITFFLLTLLGCKASNGPSTMTKNLFYVLDGVPSSKAVFDKLINENIAEVIVLKGESAVTLFGTKAKNGAVLIATKAAAKKIYTRNLSAFSSEYSRKIQTLRNDSELLYVIDGIPLYKEPEAKLYKLKAAQISSLTLMGPEDAKTTFGVDKKDGAVIITTRK